MQGGKRHEEGNNTARRKLRDGFGRGEGRRGREDRRFGERTPLTRDWKVTRSCDCVWTAKFEGRKPTTGRSRPSPASIYPICRAIVFVKIINRYVSIDGVADSFVIGTTSNAENSTMRFYHVRASAPERDENRELFQPRGIFMENEEIRDWPIRKSPRRTSAIRFTMIVIALLNSRRRPSRPISPSTMLLATSVSNGCINPFRYFTNQFARPLSSVLTRI